MWRVSESGRVAPYWRQTKKGKRTMDRIGEERVQAEEGLEQGLAVIDRVRALVRARIEDTGRASVEEAMGVGKERVPPPVTKANIRKAYVIIWPARTWWWTWPSGTWWRWIWW